jgi:hypothetical protein
MSVNGVNNNNNNNNIINEKEHEESKNAKCDLSGEVMMGL